MESDFPETVGFGDMSHINGPTSSPNARYMDCLLCGNRISVFDKSAGCQAVGTPPNECDRVIADAPPVEPPAAPEPFPEIPSDIPAAT